MNPISRARHSDLMRKCLRAPQSLNAERYVDLDFAPYGDDELDARAEVDLAIKPQGSDIDRLLSGDDR